MSASQRGKIFVLLLVLICHAVSAVVSERSRSKKLATTDDSAAVHILSIDPPYHIYSAQRQFFKQGRVLRPLIAPPEFWVKSLAGFHSHLDNVTVSVKTLPSTSERACHAYLELLSQFVLGTAYGSAEKSMKIDGSNEFTEFNATRRAVGEDMTYLGTSMIGTTRLRAFRDLLLDILKRDVRGDIVETGVWRGGASIYARGVLRAYSTMYPTAIARRVILCDSFAGLPPGNASYHRGDVGWNALTYLNVAAKQVMQHFHEVNLLDNSIIFAQGFFNHTMRPLATFLNDSGHSAGIAILRLDGDLYESTTDVLYHLYPLVTVGGYVIVDDWDGFPAKDALLDFFAVHHVTPKIVPVDRWSVYFQKTEALTEVQYWRYEQKIFSAKDQNKGV